MVGGQDNMRNCIEGFAALARLRICALGYRIEEVFLSEGEDSNSQVTSHSRQVRGKPTASSGG